MNDPSSKVWTGYLAALAVARSALGWIYPGFLTGDDVEILQEGLRRVSDLSYVPWSIRNTIVSDVLVAPALWIGRAIGIGDPWNLCWFASLPFTAASIASVELLRRIVSRLASSDRTGLLAAGVYSLHWIPFGYAGTVYPRTAATTAVLFAAWLLVRRPSGISCFAAGLLSALAFAFRYSECLYLLPLTALLAHRLRPEADVPRLLRSLAALATGFAAGALLFVGFYEWLTAGSWFASLSAFADYTLVERQASSLVREQAWFWYLWRSPRWLDPLALGLLGYGLWRGRLRELLPFVVLPLLVLSTIHHKDLRYLQGVIPFSSALVASGAEVLCRRRGKALAALLLLPSLLFSLAQLRFLEKKSMAAVAAARAIAGDPGVRSVAAPQLWAFGDRIVFAPGTELRQISHPLQPGTLEREIGSADRVAIYASSLAAGPGARDVLDRLGYCEAERFEAGRSEAVVLFAPCRAGPSGAVEGTAQRPSGAIGKSSTWRRSSPAIETG